jgi:hypothetical protein
MSSRITLYIGSLVMAIILMSSISNASHSPGAKSSSPGDGADCTSCHAGSAQSGTSWISSTIPMTGYVPGTTYTITLTGTHTGVVKFGFELTAEDASNTKKGVFSITNANETQLTNMMHAVTHTGNGLTPSNNSKSWSFDWTAPVAGTGGITFYASLNAADGNNAASGDVIYNTNYTYTEDISAGIDNESQANLFNIYPNPANDVLSIEALSSGLYEVKVLDLAGKLILSEQLEGGLENKSINIENLAKGVYIIQIQDKDTQYAKRFIKR